MANKRYSDATGDRADPLQAEWRAFDDRVYARILAPQALARATGEPVTAEVAEYTKRMGERYVEIRKVTGVFLDALNVLQLRVPGHEGVSEPFPPARRPTIYDDIAHGPRAYWDDETTGKQTDPLYYVWWKFYEQVDARLGELNTLSRPNGRPATDDITEYWYSLLDRFEQIGGATGTLLHALNVPELCTPERIL
jgi:hypothetical protein